VARLQEIRDHIAEKVPVVMDAPGVELLQELQQIVIGEASNGRL
jgi:hypothetical protein